MDELVKEWWNKLPLYHADKINRRLLAARHFSTEQSYLKLEQVEYLYNLYKK